MIDTLTGHAPGSSVDPAEVERFSRIAAEWWDPHGKFAPLHRFNPVRLGFIREQALERFGRDPKARESVTVDFAPIKESKIGELLAKFDVVLGMTPEA